MALLRRIFKVGRFEKRKIREGRLLDKIPIPRPLKKSKGGLRDRF